MCAGAARVPLDDGLRRCVPVERAERACEHVVETDERVQAPDLVEGQHPARHPETVLQGHALLERLDVLVAGSARTGSRPGGGRSPSRAARRTARTRPGCAPRCGCSARPRTARARRPPLARWSRMRAPPVRAAARRAHPPRRGGTRCWCRSPRRPRSRPPPSREARAPLAPRRFGRQACAIARRVDRPDVAVGAFGAIPGAPPAERGRARARPRRAARSCSCEARVRPGEARAPRRSPTCSRRCDGGSHPPT